MVGTDERNASRRELLRDGRKRVDQDLWPLAFTNLAHE